MTSTYDKMKAAGVEAHLHVAEKMGHVYPLWPCPEGRKARKEIAQNYSYPYYIQCAKELG